MNIEISEFIQSRRAKNKQPVIKQKSIVLKNNILNKFIDIRKGKTNIIISHRVSTLANSDEIIVIENGEIIQKGIHEELIKKEGFYQEIYNLQKLEEGK